MAATTATAAPPAPRSWLGRLRPRQLGLRTRILASFSLGALLLSTILAGATYVVTRSSLIHQRDRTAVQEAQQNARQVQDALRSNPPALTTTLTDLQTPAGVSPLIFTRGSFFGLNSEFDRRNIPQALQRRVTVEHVAARMIFKANGQTLLAVGVPLEGAASYFEISQLDELQRTLRSVSFSVIGPAALTTALGVMLGAWASRRTVRPLADAAQAAKAIAGGRLDTRLQPTEDNDLRVLAEAFNDMAAALQQRVERDGRFASDVSHELRSPLMTLSASIEVMQARRDEMPERAVAALDLLVADVARFKGLVEDLLEISRFDAGAIRLHLEELLVSEFVRQAVSVSSVRDAPVRVSDLAEELVIQGDKRRLARAIANLIDNARIYGDGEITISVAEPPDEGEHVSHVHIAVEDHGPGVPVEERRLVFERFNRGTGAGRRGMGEGAGLGLALVDEHVRLHGGRVWVEDRTDGEPGARFVIELPAERV
jgi:two-component system sensor histidine kinase MtrB